MNMVKSVQQVDLRLIFFLAKGPRRKTETSSYLQSQGLRLGFSLEAEAVQTNKNRCIC